MLVRFPAVPPAALTVPRCDDTTTVQVHSRREIQDGLLNLMTIMYMFIQVVLGDLEGVEWIRDELGEYRPRVIARGEQTG